MKQTTFYTKFLKEKCINTAGQLVNPLDFSFKRVERKKNCQSDCNYRTGIGVSLISQNNSN